MSGCRSISCAVLRQPHVNAVRRSAHLRSVVVRGSTVSGAPADTSGKPSSDNTKVSTHQPSAAPDNRQSSSSSSAPASGASKRKGSWTPPYPSLINNKPLPTEDVKTNIDF